MAHVKAIRNLQIFQCSLHAGEAVYGDLVSIRDDSSLKLLCDVFRQKEVADADK